MLRFQFLLWLVFSFLISKSQTKNAVITDSTFNIFPNPSHDQVFVTTQGRVNYAMLITTNGAKRLEYLTYDLLSYSNQFGFGCTQAGCAGAFVSSNYICTIYRKNTEDGLYYLVLFDDLGQVYHTILVYN